MHVDSQYKGWRRSVLLWWGTVKRPLCLSQKSQREMQEMMWLGSVGGLEEEGRGPVMWAIVLTWAFSLRGVLTAELCSEGRAEVLNDQQSVNEKWPQTGDKETCASVAFAVRYRHVLQHFTLGLDWFQF